MSSRSKSSKPARPFPFVLGEGGRRAILRDGDPWLRTWRVARTLTLEALAKRSGLPLDRIETLDRELDEPTPEEMEALARGLGTTVEEIEAVQD